MKNNYRSKNNIFHRDEHKSMHEVYIISSNDFIKIGLSYNSKARLKTLQVGNADILNIELCLNVPTFMECERFEKFLHNKFIQYHHRGEWFKKFKNYKNIIQTIYENYSIDNKIRLNNALGIIEEEQDRINYGSKKDVCEMLGFKKQV